MLIILLLLTLFIVGAYAAVITRHSRSVLLLGMILPIVIFVFIGLFLELILTRAIIFFIFLSIGITFIIWSDSIDDNESSTIEDISIKKRQKYKYWLYSAIIFCIAGFAVGILSKKFIYFEDTMLLVMVCLLLAGILQFVIYYIICKIRAFRAKKICSEKP